MKHYWIRDIIHAYLPVVTIMYLHKISYSEVRYFNHLLSWC